MKRTLTSPLFPTFSHEARLYGTASRRVKAKKGLLFQLLQRLSGTFGGKIADKKALKNKQIQHALKVKCYERTRRASGRDRCAARPLNLSIA
jgi:hypothetical protein